MTPASRSERTLACQSLQWESLTARGDVWLPSDDSQGSTLGPHVGHHGFAQALVSEMFEHSPNDLILVELPNRVGYHKAHNRQAVPLPFDELVIGRPAAEPRRQDLLYQGEEVASEEIHPLARQLLVASDCVEVALKPAGNHLTFAIP